ncbi:MAG: hypothetical protein MZV49_06145 [Rhodopseudomonas palustris]|nr:hypothetical protein [Rhodopseudomonas palustris]
MDSCHRSVSHSDVFAAGDVCSREDPHFARSGVHAVRAGPVLAANLAVALIGGHLREYRPRRRSLYLLACGPRSAIVSWGNLSAGGRWAWWWKDRIDRGFVGQHFVERHLVVRHRRLGSSMNATLPLLKRTDFPALRRRVLETLQVNLGYRCNQSCVHCHVNAGPNRTEMMDRDTLELVPEVLRARGVRTLDLTGGAPELHDGFPLAGERGARASASGSSTAAISRSCSSPARRTSPEFLARHRVEIVASLPCYSADNVDRQRGKGVFDKSIAGAAAAQRARLRPRRLRAGAEPGLQPAGPGAAARRRRALEADYKRELLRALRHRASTACSCWPTCRSSASAPCWCPRAGSTRTCACSRRTTPPATSTA